MISCVALQAEGIWDGTIGNYDDPLNWDTNAVPGAVNIDVSNGGTIQVTTNHNTNDILAGTGVGTTGTWDQSAGTLTMNGGWLRLGVGAGSTGTFTISGGTLNTTYWTRIGEQGSGILNINGGQVNRTAHWDPMVVGSREGGNGGPNSHGTVNHTAGTLTTIGEIWIANGNQNQGVEGGQYNLSGTGELNISNWFAIGRLGGQGVFNMSGGTVNKTAGGNLTISTGTGGQGTINQSGGVFNNSTQTFVGESWNGDGNGTWTLSGTGVANLTDVIIGTGGASTGTFNLDGGTLKANRIWTTSAGTSTFNFNGGTLQAGANQANFLSGLSAANVEAAGAVIDTNGFNIGIGQALLAGSVGGGLTKKGGGVLTLSGANGYTGSTLVSGGELVGTSTGALPGWNSPGKISVAASAGLGVQLGGAGVSEANFVTMLGNGNFAAGSRIVVDTVNGNTSFSSNFGTATNAGTNVGLIKLSPYELTIDPTAQTFTGGMEIREGWVVLDHAGSHALGNAAISGSGGLRVQGSGDTTVSGTNSIGGFVTDGTGTTDFTGTLNSGSLRIDNTATLGGTSTTNLTGWFSVGVNNGGQATIQGSASLSGISDFNVGDIGSGQSVVRMTGGSVGYNTLYIGKNATTSGVLLQSGGDLTETPGGDESRIGGVSSSATGVWGAYHMSGGTLTSNGNFQIGSHGIGVMEVNGGVVNMNSWTAVGRFQNGATESYGLLDVKSGSFNHNSVGTRLFAAESGNGVINVRGSGLITTTGGVILGGGGGAADAGNGTFNLGAGGTLVTPLVGQFNNANANGNFNFHGGTLKPNADSATFFEGIDQALVWSGGANIDTDGRNITINQALLAPGGNGVTTIGVLNGGSGYVGAPFVEITGGGGSGATAVANLDGSGGISSITITNPGTGYISTPTVNILGGGTGTGLLLDTAATGVNAGGGLSKSGNGTLTLGGVNTYTGATTITGGTLALGSGGSINQSSQIIVGASTTFNVSAVAGYTLANGQTLGGNGQVVGAATIGAGSTLAPGESIGTMNFIDALTLAGTSEFEIDAAADTADLAVVAAALVFGGNLNVSNIDGTLALGQSFDLFDFDNGLSSGIFANVNLPDLGGGGLLWDQSQLYTSGVIAVVPETSAGLLAAIGALALLRRRRNGHSGQ